MREQLDYYRKKLLDSNQFQTTGLCLVAQDDDLLVSGDRDVAELLQQVLLQSGSTCLLVGNPASPFIDLLLAATPSNVNKVVPQDTETRTFLHDIPLVRAADLDTQGVDRILECLSGRKGCIVEGYGLLAMGSMTVEQGYVNLCSLLHACSIKVLLDLLREPLPEGPQLDLFVEDLPRLCGPLSEVSEDQIVAKTNSPNAIRQSMQRVGDLTVKLGLVDSFFGNISVATESAVYITQTGASLDRLEGCIDLVPDDDSSCAGLTASSELAAHRAIYEQAGKGNILHGHPRFTVVLSLLCEEEDCKTNDCWKDCARIRLLNGKPVVAGEVGAGGLAQSLPPVIDQCGIAIVYGHGVFAKGTGNFDRPLAAMLELENWCRSTYLERITKRLEAGTQLS